MNFMQAIFLGAVQGITEFLPISSSAHLVIFQKIFGLQYHDIVFDLVVHLATLLSVFTVFYHALFQIAKEVVSFPLSCEKSSGTKVFMLVFWGSIPTAFIGFTFKDVFEGLFSSLLAVGIFMCITGIVLFLTGFTKSSNHGLHLGSRKWADSIEQISIRKAVIIGLAQGGAIAPGISRSGVTISTGLFLGMGPDAAALYSFLLAIPAIIGASLSELSHIHWSSGRLTVLGAGFISSYFFGLLGLRWVLKVVRQGRFELFSIYMWTVGGIAIYSAL